MFSAELELLKPGTEVPSLRTGIAAGAPVPKKMMNDLQKRLNMVEVTNTYGINYIILYLLY
jgi:long-chain acyl-CoA synthetase